MKDFFINIIDFIKEIIFIVPIIVLIINYKNGRKYKKELSEIKKSIGENSAVVDSDNEKIWEGFDGLDFKSYNDPWNMETSKLGKYIKVHKERYKIENNTQYKFLFFCKEDIDSFERFIKFQSSVHLNLEFKEFEDNQFKEKLKEHIDNIIETNGKLPDSLHKIQVFINYKSDIPHLTFFRGHKSGIKIALLYFTIKLNQEFPNAIFKTSDKFSWLELDKTWDEGIIQTKEIKGIDIFNHYLNL
jgi:hypothetical protein